MWWFSSLLNRGREKPGWVANGASLRSYSRRGREIDQIILHESVTRRITGKGGAVDILKKRKLGVHFSIDSDEEGTVRCHVPISKACSHAGGGHNLRSLGIEIASRYYGSRAEDGDEVINGMANYIL